MIIFLWISVALVRYCFGLHVMLKDLNYSEIVYSVLYIVTVLGPLLL